MASTCSAGVRSSGSSTVPLASWVYGHTIHNITTYQDNWTVKPQLRAFSYYGKECSGCEAMVLNFCGCEVHVIPIAAIDCRWLSACWVQLWKKWPLYSFMDRALEICLINFYLEGLAESQMIFMSRCSIHRLKFLFMSSQKWGLQLYFCPLWTSSVAARQVCSVQLIALVTKIMLDCCCTPNLVSITLTVHAISSDQISTTSRSDSN